MPATLDYLQRNLPDEGYSVAEQRFQVDGQQVSNLEVILPGYGSAETVVVGAHYEPPPARQVQTITAAARLAYWS